MNAILDILQNAGIFLAGLTVRLAFFLAVLAVFLIPVLAVFYSVEGIKTLRRRSDGSTEVIGGVRIIPRRRYAPGHLWLGRRLFGGLRVGLDDLAQRLFPNLSAVELPKKGRRLRKGEPGVVDGFDLGFGEPVEGYVGERPLAREVLPEHAIVRVPKEPPRRILSRHRIQSR